jgi:hypothetical protein
MKDIKEGRNGGRYEGHRERDREGKKDLERGARQLGRKGR